MICYSSLNELVTKDEKSKALFDGLSKEAQVALQEQRQDVCSYDELASIAAGMQKRAH